MPSANSRAVLSTTAAAAIGLSALVGGCSKSGDKSSDTTAGDSTTTTAKSTAAPSTTGSTTTTLAARAGKLPAAPAGAQELQSSDSGGVMYARYQISGTTAEQVVSDYESQLKSSGYSVTSSGGGGGGWGEWGGAGAGLTATGDDYYVAVQAGGESSGPVYFEVCQGSSSSAIQECENQSDGPDDDQSDSDSGAS